MKETKLLGSLIPSHPDAVVIIEQIREKYQLPEINPNEDPITEIYLGDKIIPLEEFRQEIENLVQESTIFINPESKAYNLYKQAKLYKDKPPQFKGAERFLPKSIKKSMLELYNVFQGLANFLVQMIDNQHKAIANMLYIYLLTGETEEVPNDWLSKVVPVNIEGETVVFAMASQFVDPEIIVQQFREQYAKTFGRHKPKVTNTIVSTAYFLRLRKLKKSWQFIVEEFIRLNKFSLPRDRSSKRYFETRQKYERMLRKRINRSEKVLDVLVRDIETKKT